MLRYLSLAAIALVIGGFVFLASCTNARYVIQSAPNRAPDIEANPPLLSEDNPNSTLEFWESARAPELRSLFEAHVFGHYPDPARFDLASEPLHRFEILDGLGTLEEREMVLQTESEGFTIRLAIARPSDIESPVPVFIIPNDCGNPFALKDERLLAPTGSAMPYCNAEGFGGFVGRTIFGRYVLWPPMELLLENGYGLVTYHEADVVSDNAQEAEPVLQALTPVGTPADQRTGVIAAWAWTLDHVAQALERDPGFNADQIAVMGHSRRGKAVMVAGAYGEAIDLVIAHQSGTGGASLSRRDIGESVSDITNAYPHWFAPVFSDYGDRIDALPVDQHHLIALVAPTPMLLGNARRDTWSDPVGAFIAARSAGPAWEPYDLQGFDQEHLGAFDPEQPLAFHIRFGTHGVTPEDWSAFLEFADTQFDR